MARQVPDHRTVFPGERFGLLLVEQNTGQSTARGSAIMLCRCACGNLISVSVKRLTRKYEPLRSCRCLITTPAHRSWAAAKQRCLNPKAHGYEAYGGRGITMDPRWVRSFWAFYYDMGGCPRDLNKSLERRNNDGPYCKLNCVWATTAEQSRNRRSTKLSINKVRDIRSRAPFESQHNLAKEFDVNQSAISRVVNNLRWEGV
jgi:hypothetical protein